MRQRQEKILFFALLAILVLVAVSHARRGDEGPTAKRASALQVTVTLPPSVAAADLFVKDAFSHYFPGTRPEAETIFGAPKTKAPDYRPPVLPLPMTGIPKPPAAATTPGPVLEHSGGLPRAGEDAEGWKR